MYGVATLHLTKTGMASLGRLLSCFDADLREGLDRHGLRKRYVYYFSGAVGSGKSTITCHGDVNERQHDEDVPLAVVTRQGLQ